MAQLEWRRGDDIDELLQFRNADGSITDLTSCVVWMTVKRSIGDLDVDAVLNAYWEHDGVSVGASAFLSADDPTTGAMLLNLDYMESGMLPVGTGFLYDVRLRLATGKRKTWDSGTIDIIASVTDRETTAP